MVKPTVQETHVQSLGREDLLEKEMATNSSILAWKTLWTEQPGRLQSMGSQRVGHDRATSLSLFPLWFDPHCHFWKNWSASEVAQWCLTLCKPMDCSPTRLLRPWDFPGKNTGVGCHFLLQEIFLTLGLNPGLLHCRQMLYRLSHREVILLKGYHNGYHST